MKSTEAPRVVIIGGGFAGSLTAAQLLRHAKEPLEVFLIERRFPFGSGRAFATPLPCHVLNVPAIRMSAYPDDPGHLVRWLQERAGELGSGLGSESAFLPRQIYGAYVSATLEAAAEHSPGRLTRVVGEAVAVNPGAGREGVRVLLRDGSTLAASHVVLAIGNPPPSDPFESEALQSSRRYARDPWDGQAFQEFGIDDTVMTIGSNLTMVDVALALDHRGHTGPILAVSTHGLLPQSHPRDLPPAWISGIDQDARGPLALLRVMRLEARGAANEGIGWRSVVDSLRPRIASIWASWPDAERRRFLRHARPYWEVHRHRMAPENAETISALIRAGRLRALAGRITGVSETEDAIEVRVVRRGATRPEVIRTARIVNCTGPGMDFRRSRDPLLRDLFARGLARPGPLGLGFDADPHGALIGADGRPSPTLHSLGPPLKGMYWETTAVPEIRMQAQALGSLLAGPTARGRFAS